LTLLFVDVGGSTTIAEKMNNTEFSHLMNRFSEAAMHVLVQADAFLDKLVGDEVTALFIPGFAGKDHVCRAVEARQSLFCVTSCGDRWSVGSDRSRDSDRHSMGGIHCRGERSGRG
jgi:hypothetical protein